MKAFCFAPSKIRTAWAAFCCLCALAPSAALAQVVINPDLIPEVRQILSPHPDWSNDGAFAFANRDGTRLLGPEDLTQPERLTRALCSGGRSIPIRFEARQRKTDKDTGRRSYLDFKNVSGNRFALVLGTIAREDVCFLVSDSLLAKPAVVLKVDTLKKPGDCAPDAPPRFAAARNRAVTQCWTLGHIAPDKDILVVRFARQGTQELASLILVDPRSAIYVDYPTMYLGPGNDLFRVDDGGEFTPDGLAVISLVQRGDRFTIAILWAGTEGSSLNLYESQKDRFVNTVNDYLYSAPH